MKENEDGELEWEYIICPECGCEMREDETYCIECGEGLKEEEE